MKYLYGKCTFDSLHDFLVAVYADWKNGEFNMLYTLVWKHKNGKVYLENKFYQNYDMSFDDIDQLKFTPDDMKTLTWIEVYHKILERQTKELYERFYPVELDWEFDKKPECTLLTNKNEITFEQFIKIFLIYSTYSAYDYLGGETFLRIEETKDSVRFS